MMITYCLLVKRGECMGQYHYYYYYYDYDYDYYSPQGKAEWITTVKAGVELLTVLVELA